MQLKFRIMKESTAFLSWSLMSDVTRCLCASPEFHEQRIHTHTPDTATLWVPPAPSKYYSTGLDVYDLQYLLNKCLFGELSKWSINVQNEICIKEMKISKWNYKMGITEGVFGWRLSLKSKCVGCPGESVSCRSPSDWCLLTVLGVWQHNFSICLHLHGILLPSYVSFCLPLQGLW